MCKNERSGFKIEGNIHFREQDVSELSWVTWRAGCFWWIAGRPTTYMGTGHWAGSTAVSHQPRRTAGVDTSIIRTGLWSETGLIRVFKFWVNLSFKVNTFFLSSFQERVINLNSTCSLRAILTDFHGEVGWPREPRTVPASRARRNAASVSDLHSTTTAGTIGPVHPWHPLTIHWKGGEHE